MMTKILLDPLPGTGGGTATPSSSSEPHNAETPPPAPPPAATTVLQGTKSERELQLEEENQRLAKEKKDREIKIAELEDENHRLKSPPSDPQPAPTGQEEEYRWRPFKL